MAIRVFIGNLPFEVDLGALRTCLSAAGEVANIRVPVDRDTGRQRGFAFADFPSASTAEEVIRHLDGQPFQGRPLSVREARPQGEGGGPPPRPPSSFAPSDGAFPSRSTSAPPAGRRTQSRPDSPGGRSKSGGKPEKPTGPIRERRSGRFFAMSDDGDDDLTDELTPEPNDDDSSDDQDTP